MTIVNPDLFQISFALPAIQPLINIIAALYNIVMMIF